MSNPSPTANSGDRGTEERRKTNDDADKAYTPDERNVDHQNPNKGHGPLKGTDTAATTNAEDLEKAKRTTM